MKPIALTPATAAAAAVAGFLALQAGGIAADRGGLFELAQALICDATGILLALYGVGLAAYGLHELGAAIADKRTEILLPKLFQNQQTA